MATISGTILNDTINTSYVTAGVIGGVATVADDTINAGNGDDNVAAGDGNDLVTGEAGWDTLYGNAGNDTLDGGFGSDNLYGEVGDDSLLGGYGEDDLRGGDGLDTLVGGAGDDYMEGNQGADTYILNKNSGQDRISNYDSDSSLDVAKFTDVATSDVKSITRYGNDLVLGYGVSGAQLTVLNYFYSDSATYRIDTFDFTNADWTVTDIKNQVITKGTEFTETLYGYNGGPNNIFAYGGDDNVYGGDGNDNLDGGNGSDYITGSDGNDSLSGQSGEDDLRGGNGLDTLVGGAGDDSMEGNQGADTYFLTMAGGQDVINNYDSDSSIDTAKFSDVATTDVTSIIRYGNDLVLNYGVAGGQLTLLNYFYSDSANYRTDVLDFTNADWTVTDIKNQVITKGTESGETIYGYNTGANRIFTYGGDDNVYGGDGNDSLDGGNGADYLRGYDGNDTLLGQSGADDVRGDNGNDSITGGAGDDYMEGNQGADTYFLTKTSGFDRINNYDSDNSIDVAKFSNVASTDLTEVVRYGNDLLLNYGPTGQLTLVNYFYSDNASYRTDTLDFTDTDWTVTEVKNHVITKGTELAETISGYNSGPNNTFAYGGNDNVYGGDGNDNLDGGNGADLLQGYDGNDSLSGQADADDLHGDNGNDTLNGGTGDDYLQGNQGADTYILSMAGGQDRITNYDSDNSIDVAVFTDVATTDVTAVTRYGNDLLLEYGAGGQLKVLNYFYSDNAAYRLDTFAFTNGDWGVSDIKARVITMGTESSETIYGYNTGANTVFGRGGNDNVYGGDGNDSLDGGAQNDYLKGYDGNDMLLGQTGADALYGDNGNDTLNGGGGNDYMEGNQGADTYILTKAGGQDRIANYDSDSSIDVARFTDVATTDVSSITRYGNDLVLTYGASAGQLTVVNYFTSDNAVYRIDTFDLTNADWTVADIKSRVITKGTELNDNISGYNTGTNRIFSYGGDDNVYGGDGNDSLDSGTGNDYLVGNDGDDSLLGQGGADRLYGSNGSDTLNGGTGDDQLQGDQGADTYVIALGDGHDIINNYDSDSAADVVQFSNVTLCDLTDALRIGNDFVLGFGGDSQITVKNHFAAASYQMAEYRFADGAMVNNLVMGTSGSESLIGGALTNDMIVGAGGTDTMTGAAGNDVYWTDGGDTIVEAAAGGTDTVLSGVSYTLSADLENLSLLAGATDGTGNAADNVLCGNDAVNTLTGHGGNDTLNGEGGADVMVGGAGNDVYIVDIAGDTVTELAAEGNDTINSSVTFTISANVENLVLTGNTAINGTGNAVNNILTGNSAANFLNGGLGADTMAGGGGNDTYVVNVAGDVVTELAASGNDLIQSAVTRTLSANVESLTLTGVADINGTGEAGANTLTGNTGANILSGLGGNDALNGGAGNDTLNGGIGKDNLSGGAGADTFVFDAAPIATNADTISDFSHVDDTIQLSLSVYTALGGAGALASGAFALSTDVAALDDRIIYDDATGALYYDADGSLATIAAVQIATLGAGLGLSAADFLVV